MAVTPQKEHFKLAGFHARANPFNHCLYLFLNEASKHLFAHCSYKFQHPALVCAEEQQNKTYMSPAATGCLKIHEVCHIHSSLPRRTEISCEPKRQRHLNLFILNVKIYTSHLAAPCQTDKLKMCWNVWGKIPSELVKPN